MPVIIYFCPPPVSSRPLLARPHMHSLRWWALLIVIYYTWWVVLQKRFVKWRKREDLQKDAERCHFMKIERPRSALEPHLKMPFGGYAWVILTNLSQGLRPLPLAPFSSSWLPFGRLGASNLAPWWTILAPWEHLGEPWEQQDGFEGVRHRIFIDFGVFSGPYFGSLFITRLEIPIYFGLVSRSFCFPSFESNFRRLGFLKPGFRMERVAKNNFSQKSSFVDFGVYLSCFLKALGTVFLVFAALETRLKLMDFW